MDEVALLGTLQHGTLTPDQFSKVMNMLIIACYDRKVTREFMIEMVHAVGLMHRVLADIDVAAALEYMRRAALKPARGKKITSETALMSPAIEKATAQFKVVRQQITDAFATVTQCATAADTIS